MVLSRRKAWIAAGIGARLLMIAVLAVSVPLTLHNDTKLKYNTDFYKLQSYSYTVAVAVIAMAAGVLQIPVAVYLLCISKRMTPSSLILDISLCADVVVTVLLASGVGAGFGATNDALRYVHHVTWDDNRTKDDLIDYYNKAILPVSFIVIGMVLSMAATVVSARLRTRATADAETSEESVTSSIRVNSRIINSVQSLPNSVCVSIPTAFQINSAWGISDQMHGSDPAVDLAPPIILYTLCFSCEMFSLIIIYQTLYSSG